MDNHMLLPVIYTGLMYALALLLVYRQYGEDSGLSLRTMAIALGTFGLGTGAACLLLDHCVHVADGMAVALPLFPGALLAMSLFPGRSTERPIPVILVLAVLLAVACLVTLPFTFNRVGQLVPSPPPRASS